MSPKSPQEMVIYLTFVTFPISILVQSSLHRGHNESDVYPNHASRTKYFLELRERKGMVWVWPCLGDGFCVSLLCCVSYSIITCVLIK